MRKIEIVIEGESWVVVFDKNERLLYELMQTGSYELSGISPLRFKIGYAPATNLYIDDQKIIIPSPPPLPPLKNRVHAGAAGQEAEQALQVLRLGHVQAGRQLPVPAHLALLPLQDRKQQRAPQVRELQCERSKDSGLGRAPAPLGGVEPRACVWQSGPLKKQKQNNDST